MPSRPHGDYADSDPCSFTNRETAHDLMWGEGKNEKKKEKKRAGVGAVGLVPYMPLPLLGVAAGMKASDNGYSVQINAKK